MSRRSRRSRRTRRRFAREPGTRALLAQRAQPMHVVPRVGNLNVNTAHLAFGGMTRHAIEEARVDSG